MKSKDHSTSSKKDAGHAKVTMSRQKTGSRRKAGQPSAEITVKTGKKAASFKTWIIFEPKKSLHGKFENLHNLFNIVKSAKSGVKPQVFYSFASTAGIPDKYLAELINTSPRTLSNYKDQDKTLEPTMGEHLLKIIALFKKGEEVFGNLHEFHNWLVKPLMGLKEAPLGWLDTPGGVDLISQEMDRIAEGYPL